MATATLSVETLNFLAVLLSQVTLTPTADDFDEQAAMIGKARRELLAALAKAEAPRPNRAARRHPSKPRN